MDDRLEEDTWMPKKPPQSIDILPKKKKNKLDGDPNRKMDKEHDLAIHREGK